MRRLVLILALVVGLVLSQSVVLAQAQLDPDFGAGGRTVVPGGGVFALERLADGRFFVAGYNNNSVAVWRFHSNGSLDTTFGEDGLAEIDMVPGQYDTAEDMKIDRDGRIIVGGTGVGDAFIFVLTPGGSLDPSFSGDGKMFIDFGTTTESIAHLWIDQDDRETIYFSGRAAEYGWYLGKVKPDGTLDQSFDTDGVKYIGYYRYPAGITQDSQSRIVAAASEEFGGGANRAVMVRLDTNGTYDNTFSSDGLSIFNVNSPETSTQIFELTVDPDDKIVVVTTWALIYVSIARLTVDGSLDSSFGSGGTTKFNPASDDMEILGDVHRDSQGRYLVVGSAWHQSAPTTATSFVARFTASGIPDTSFAANGILFVDFPEAMETAQQMILFPSDNPLVAAHNNPLATVFRIDVGEPQLTANPVQNPSFETTDSSQASKAQSWSGANLTKDKRTCNTISPPVTYSHSGNCAFLFKGGSGEKSQISQTINPDPSLLTAGTALTLSAWVESAANSVLGKIVVYYTDGTKQAFSVAMGPALSYTQFSSAPFFLAKNASKFKVSFKHTYPSGKLYLDDVALIPNAARTRDGVLPVPAAPSAAEGWRLP